MRFHPLALLLACLLLACPALAVLQTNLREMTLARQAWLRAMRIPFAQYSAVIQAPNEPGLFPSPDRRYFASASARDVFLQSHSLSLQQFRTIKSGFHFLTWYDVALRELQNNPSAFDLTAPGLAGVDLRDAALSPEQRAITIGAASAVDPPPEDRPPAMVRRLHRLLSR